MTASSPHIITHDGTTLYVACPQGTSEGFDLQHVTDDLETDLSRAYLSVLCSWNRAKLHGHSEAARILDRYLQDLAQILNHIVTTKHGQPPEASDDGILGDSCVARVAAPDRDSGRQGAGGIVR